MKITTKEAISRHLIVKLLETKNKCTMLKEARKIHYIGKIIKYCLFFIKEMRQKKRKKAMKETKCLAAAAAKSLQSTLWDPRDGSPPGSSVPQILQARILDWVVFAFSRD